MFDRAHGFSGVLLAPGGLEMGFKWVNEALFPLLPVFLLPFGLALASLVAQRAFAVSLEKIVPKFSRTMSLLDQSMATNTVFLLYWARP